MSSMDRSGHTDRNKSALVGMYSGRGPTCGETIYATLHKLDKSRARTSGGTIGWFAYHTLMESWETGKGGWGGEIAICCNVEFCAG